MITSTDASKEDKPEFIELKLSPIILPIGWVRVYSAYYTGTDRKVYLV